MKAVLRKAKGQVLAEACLQDENLRVDMLRLLDPASSDTERCKPGKDAKPVSIARQAFVTRVGHTSLYLTSAQRNS